MDWIDLTQDQEQFRGRENTGINLGDHWLLKKASALWSYLFGCHDFPTSRTFQTINTTNAVTLNVT
jgi:hypothetical protein